MNTDKIYILYSQYGKYDDVRYEFNGAFTIKLQRKPTHFSRWMNLVNNFINIFGSLK